MAPKFGTSGLRGLVTELTPALVADYTRAFLDACPTGGAVQIGWDLRPSSPAIADAVIDAVRQAGVRAVSLGAVPTPALALSAMRAGHAAVMVTGSHIPADRNGLKFYRPDGEISKADEAAIIARLGAPAGSGPAAAVTAGADAARAYVERIVAAFGSSALAGLRIGVYQHSSVARDLMVEAMAALGATPVPLARSDSFIPVDTEAVDPETRALLTGWCRDHALDAVISTDGDADRPMLADATGRIVPGDVLGALTARMLGAEAICTPVSSNSMIASMPEFTQVRLTRIGSPFVIAAMEAVLADSPDAKVVGYEANGGFLLGFAAMGGRLAPLMTRDSLLPIVAPLAAAVARGQTMAELVAGLPQVFTFSDRIPEVPTEASAALISRLATDAAARASFFATGADETGLDQTDGLRVRFADGAVVHLRPSGNAPECRCYAEAATPDAAEALVRAHLARLRAKLGGPADP